MSKIFRKTNYDVIANKSDIDIIDNSTELITINSNFDIQFIIHSLKKYIYKV